MTVNMMYTHRINKEASLRQLSNWKGVNIIEEEYRSCVYANKI